MRSYSEFLAKEAALTRYYEPFLRRFEPEKVVTLSDLLSGNVPAWGSWIDVPQLNARLASMCFFFFRAKQPLEERLPFVFFGKPNIKRDEKRHLELMRRARHLVEKYGEASASAHYLHPNSNFYFKPFVDPVSKGTSLWPLMQFTSWGGVQIAPELPEERRSATVLGYHLVDYPKLLGISKKAATDYLARVVIHDIGHAVLPLIDPYHEPLHDAVMKFAMFVPTVRGRSPWEHFVWSECTDPYFSTRAQEHFKNCRFLRLTPTQRHLLTSIEKREKETETLCFPLWNIRKFSETERRNMVAIMQDMIGTGFARYSTPLERPVA